MSASRPRPESVDELVERLRSVLAARADDPAEILLHERRLPAQPARSGILRPRLPPPLARALVSLSIGRLYQHQVEAVEHLRAHRHVVLASPTASGKSLAFAVPTFERLLLQPDRHAVYVYPTKALIGDQLRALRRLAAALPAAERPSIGVLTGDTPRAERLQLAARPPSILLANPDILHHSLLPDHRRWRGLLGHLDLVVLDELHSYRGVFGAHVALVLRRLRRLAAAYGAQPVFVAASATIGNPVELAEQIVGVPFAAIQGDAAGAGPRRFVFWRPPLRGAAAANEHESVLSEAAAIFAEALNAGYTGILFGRARQSVERMLLEVRRLVDPALAERVSAYKSGYRSDDRARIEAGLRSGQLHGVVSTNALELGIDIGSLDVAVLAGYPGSNMSFWQQAGRVGRRAEREALVVLVAGDDALDQYHVQHPDAFFGRAMEQAAVDPSNAAIQLGHLLCAAAERPLDGSDLALFPTSAERLVARLAEAGEVSHGPPWHWPAAYASNAGRLPHLEVSLRGTSREPYTLHDPRGELGTIEPPYLQRECYPGAIYLHNGRGYRVARLDPRVRVVRLEDAPADIRTTPVVEIEVAPRDEPLANRQVTVGEGCLLASVGPLRVTQTVVGYREERRGQAYSFALDEPLVLRLDTVGVWLDVPGDLEPDAAALHAFEHALVNALPIGLLCDRRDVGSSSQQQRVTVYDFVDGGIGLSEKAYHLMEQVLERAAGLLRDCPCTEGCPACVHLAGCPEANANLDKLGGLALLEGRSVPAARAAARLLRAPRPAAGWDADHGQRRRRLRAIAEADLRERYAAGRPGWPQTGDLAQAQDIGLVLVWSVAHGMAEVQSLSSGETVQVPLGALAPVGL